MVDLELRGVSKTYGTVVAVEDLSLEVDAGDMVALLGPSGCGKTTTLRMVAGFVEPTAGAILVRGRDITALPPDRRDMGMVFQSYALFPHMTVRGNVEFGLRWRRLGRAEMVRRVADVLALVGLEGLADRYPRQLSGGQQQRVAVARVLVLEPKLLLFDEPLSNLDAKLRLQMRHEIRRLQKEVGITALFVTHDQEEALTIADKVLVLDRGRVEQYGTAAEVYDEPRTRFVAEFIGTSNLFAGRLEDKPPRPFVTAGGLRLAVGPARAAGGGEVLLMIRPEKVVLGPARGGDALRAEVTRVTRLSGTLEYALALPGGERMVAHELDGPHARPRRVGEPVEVSWRAEDARLVAAARR